MRKTTLKLLTALVFTSAFCAASNAAEPEPERIRVGTYNMWVYDARDYDFQKKEAYNVFKYRSWKNSKDSLFFLVNEMHPDVLVMQEGCAETLNDVKKLLAKYCGKDYKIWYFLSDPNNGSRSSNIIIYRGDKLSISNRSAFWLSETPDVPSEGWDEKKHPRTCLCAVFTSKATGKKFFFMGTHAPLKPEANKASGKIFIEKEKELNPSGMVCVLTGDLNARLDKESPLLDTLKTWWHDSYDVNTGVKDPERGTHYGVGGDAGHPRCLDYVFIRSKNDDDYEVVDHSVVRKRYMIGGVKKNLPSDHCPIMIDIILK